MADNEGLKRIYNLFTDCWRYYKKYADVQDTDQYWESVVDESGELSKKYDNDKFAIALVLAVVDEFERKAKELRLRDNKEVRDGN